MRLGKSTFVHFASQALTSLSGFIATLAIARLLGAEALGTYAVLIALLFWFNIPAEAIGSAITKRMSEGKELAETFSAGTGLLALIGSAVVILLVVDPGYLQNYVGAPVAPLFVLLIVSSLFFVAADAKLRGEKRVATSGLLFTFERLTRTIFQVGLILAGYSLSGLVFGHAVALFVAGVIGLLLSDVATKIPSRKHFENIVGYARYSWVGTLHSRAFAWMDTIILKFFVASSLIGVYEVSWTLASTLGLVANSVNQTLFPEISELSSEGDYERIRHYLNEGLVFTGVFLIPGFFGAVALGPRILRIYGSEFVSGSLILLILIIARLFAAFDSQFRGALNGIDRPDVAFRISTLTIVLNISANIVLIWQFGWYGAAVATTISAVVSLCLGYRALGEIIGTPDIPWRELVIELAASLSMVVVIFGVEPLIPINHYATVGLVFLGAGIYTAVLLTLSTRIRQKALTLIPWSIGLPTRF